MLDVGGGRAGESKEKKNSNKDWKMKEDRKPEREGSEGVLLSAQLFAPLL